MARDKLGASFGQDLDALKEDLSRRDTGPLGWCNCGSRAVCDDELQGQGLYHLNAAGWDPDIAEPPTENAGCRRGGGEDAILDILMEDSLARVWIAYTSPIGVTVVCGYKL